MCYSVECYFILITLVINSLNSICLNFGYSASLLTVWKSYLFICEYAPPPPPQLLSKPLWVRGRQSSEVPAFIHPCTWLSQTDGCWYLLQWKEVSIHLLLFSLFFKRLSFLFLLFLPVGYEKEWHVWWQLFSLQGTHKHTNKRLCTQAHSNGYLNNGFFTSITEVLFLR